MLHSERPHAIAGCSQAPRGLFVLLRGTRIFTRPSISPGPLLRQCPDRYALRAGRNLPDKEFRYLRTVIVTAAVHRGFNSKPCPLRDSPLLLTFRHWAGVSPYTSPCGLAETCVFVKQSPGPLHCGSPRGERPFSRSYGAILPSSLTRVLPCALVYSTRLPVSVCGTVSLLLRQCAFLGGRIGALLTHRSGITAHTAYHPHPLKGCTLRPRPACTPQAGTGLLTRCPSPTLFSLG